MLAKDSEEILECGFFCKYNTYTTWVVILSVVNGLCVMCVFKFLDNMSLVFSHILQLILVTIISIIWYARAVCGVYLEIVVVVAVVVVMDVGILRVHHSCYHNSLLRLDLKLTLTFVCGGCTCIIAIGQYHSGYVSPEKGIGSARVSKSGSNREGVELLVRRNISRGASSSSRKHSDSDTFEVDVREDTLGAIAGIGDVDLGVRNRSTSVSPNSDEASRLVPI